MNYSVTWHCADGSSYRGGAHTIQDAVRLANTAISPIGVTTHAVVKHGNKIVARIDFRARSLGEAAGKTVRALLARF